MSSKLLTSSAIIFDKLSGIAYEDGALKYCDCPVTTTTSLFGKMVGDPYVPGALQRTSDTQKTSPTIVQDGIQADLCNASSASSISVYISKSYFSEHRPYMVESSAIVFNSHFIKELRRQLSGEITFNRFSPEEQFLYDSYVAYINEIEYDSRLETALNELDFWLVEEVQNNPHPTITRKYSDTHPWMKIKTRIIEEI